MSAPELPRSRVRRPGPRWFAALLSLVLLGLCVAAAWASVTARQRWVEAAGDRWSVLPAAVADTAGVIENGGEAGLVVAEAILERSPNASARSRVQSLVLLALTAQPGSAFGRLLLGRSAVAEAKEETWARPLQLAVSAAPGLDLGTSELAIRYLASWTSAPARSTSTLTSLACTTITRPRSRPRSTSSTPVST